MEQEKKPKNYKSCLSCNMINENNIWYDKKTFYEMHKNEQYFLSHGICDNNLCKFDMVMSFFGENDKESELEEVIKICFNEK